MESEFINWFRRRSGDHPRLRLGPGDDAAILQLANAAEAVVSTDMLTEGVDFVLSQCGPRLAGRKALAVSLSDMAAMAAQPLAAVVALVVPRDDGLALATELYEGLLPLAEEFETDIAGGDTNSWDGPLVISVTAIGQPTAKGPLLRGGARAGDQILVTGAFGGSILGKHLEFQPRVREALLLNKRYDLHAAIDVSDGLSLDLWRVARESGCGALLQLESVPVAEAARQVAAFAPHGRSPLDHALTDGEDFELILAVPEDEAERLLAEQPLEIPLTRVGRFIAEAGLWHVAADGTRQPLEPRGYEH